MRRTPSDWPSLPEVHEPAPPTRRRAWGKLPHEERYKRQRQDLLRAAARLAARQGYEGTRVADIVSEAGISKSTFYEHFDSKEACFLELHRATSSQMLRAALRAAEETLPQGARACISAVIAALSGYSARDPRLARALGPELGAHVPAIAAQREQNLRRITELIETVARRLGTTLPDDELDLAATVLVRGVVATMSGGQLRNRVDELASLACRAFALETA